MEGAKPYKSPMATGLQLSRHQGEPFENPTLYRSIIGSLQYLSFTRPDIAFAVKRFELLRTGNRTGPEAHSRTNQRLN